MPVGFPMLGTAPLFPWKRAALTIADISNAGAGGAALLAAASAPAAIALLQAPTGSPLPTLINDGDTALTAATGKTIALTPGRYKRARLKVTIDSKAGTVNDMTVAMTGLTVDKYVFMGSVKAVSTGSAQPTQYTAEDQPAWICDNAAAPSTMVMDLEVGTGGYRGGQCRTWKNTATACDSLTWMHTDRSSDVSALVFGVDGGGTVTGTIELWGWP